jgi:DNA-directed RNA polymerase specialized sigma24 family protein
MRIKPENKIDERSVTLRGGPEMRGGGPPMNVSSPRLVACLTNPTFRAGLARFVRSRVPDAEVDDIVQATLSDALEAARHPDADEEISRWVYGICRHKVVDSFRRMRREVPSDLLGDDEAVSPASAPTGAMDLMHWAKTELPRGPEHEQTLEWMLREGDGEKLDVIAREAEVPAPRVRQRVSRLRRHFKARWAVEVAALAVLLVALALILRGRRHETEVAPRPEPSVEPSPTVREPPPTIAPAMSTTPPLPSASAAPSSTAVPPSVLSAAPTSIPAPRPSSLPSMPTTEERPRPRPTTLPSVSKPGGGSSI